MTALRRAIQRARPLAALAVLTGCSSAALPSEATQPEPPPAYISTAANYLAKTLKDRISYDAFEISNLRWAESFRGWSWLACVRYRDRGHRRTYVLFIQGDAVVDGRYAVRIDACDAQTFTPFDLTTGDMGSPATTQLDPLH